AVTRRLASVDIGTNSVRLLVADVEGVGADAPVTPLASPMRITRLGQAVDGDRRLHPDAIARTLAVLDEYGAAARDLGGEAIRATATSAARDAQKRDELLD